MQATKILEIVGCNGPTIFLTFFYSKLALGRNRICSLIGYYVYFSLNINLKFTSIFSAICVLNVEEVFSFLASYVKTSSFVTIKVLLYQLEPSQKLSEFLEP